jgi:hypothetical protein
MAALGDYDDHLIPYSLYERWSATKTDATILRLQGMMVFQVTRFLFGLIIRQIAKQIPKVPSIHSSPYIYIPLLH